MPQSLKVLRCLYWWWWWNFQLLHSHFIES